MNEKVKGYIGNFMLLLFVMYFGSICLFTHVHYVGGKMVCHSHPYSGGHNHTSGEFQLIAALSHFDTLDPSSLHPEDTLVLKADVFLYGPFCSGFVSVPYFGIFGLRAPPVFV